MGDLNEVLSTLSVVSRQQVQLMKEMHHSLTSNERLLTSNERTLASIDHHIRTTVPNLVEHTLDAPPILMEDLLKYTDGRGTRPQLFQVNDLYLSIWKPLEQKLTETMETKTKDLIRTLRLLNKKRILLLRYADKAPKSMLITPPEELRTEDGQEDERNQAFSAHLTERINDLNDQISANFKRQTEVDIARLQDDAERWLPRETVAIGQALGIPGLDVQPIIKQRMQDNVFRKVQLAYLQQKHMAEELLRAQEQKFNERTTRLTHLMEVDVEGTLDTRSAIREEVQRQFALRLSQQPRGKKKPQQKQQAAPAPPTARRNFQKPQQKQRAAPAPPTTRRNFQKRRVTDKGGGGGGKPRYNDKNGGRASSKPNKPRKQSPGGERLRSTGTWRKKQSPR